MTRVTETETYIRFALGQMRAANGQHQFEELCRRFARSRIARNILPATGPVSAGGDQGRDFESYLTRIVGNVGSTGLFLALADDDLLAFACTLQQDDIRSKIRSDLAAICDQGESIAAVIVFTEVDVPIAHRHSLQSHARDKYGVRLEIFDGHALAQELSDPGLFWIAEQYLDIPSAVAPEEPVVPDWYHADVERWRHRQGPATSYGDFVDIRGCTRHSTFDAAARSDLPFWIGLLRESLASQPTDRLAQRLRYEIAVATVRGIGRLESADDVTRDFFNAATELEDLGQLDDAVTLLAYVTAAWARGITGITRTEIEGHLAALEKRVDDLREGSEGLRLARLHDIAAGLCVQMDMAALPDDTPRPVFPVRIDEEAVPPTGVAFQMRNAGRAVQEWTQALRIARDTPLFPVDTIAGRVSILTPGLSVEEGFGGLTRLIDELTTDRHGRAAAAERCRDRAVALMDAGNYLTALNEFQRAWIDWFSADTLRGSLLAQLAISQCYRSLELLDAARFYALSAAAIAVGSDDDELLDLVPKALFSASDIAYVQGSWVSCLELLEVAVKAHELLAEDPWGADHPQVSMALFDAAVIRAAARSFGSPLLPRVEAAIDRCGMTAVVDEADNQHDPWWRRLSPTEFAEQISRELGHPAFADAGSERLVTWRALGVRWTIISPNDYDSAAAAEGLAAIFQILCAEIASEDLCIMPSEVALRVTIGGGGPVIQPEPNNEGRSWQAFLTRHGTSRKDVEEVAQEALGIAAVVLHDIALVPAHQVMGALERAFQEGLGAKISPGMTYASAAAVVSRERFDLSERALGQPIGSQNVTPHQHASLAWCDGPGPGFSEELSREMITNRYRRGAELLPYSLPVLRSDPRFAALVSEARDAGWKDWHILMALCNVSLNKRMRALGLDRNPAAAQEHGPILSSQPEPTEGPHLTAGDLSLSFLKQMLEGSFPAVLNSWGLELRQETPDFIGIDAVLRRRYRYWDDDVDHEPLLGD